MTADDPATGVKKISLKRIAHVYYKHANIEKAKQFLDDFGFFPAGQSGKKLYYRGYGTEPFAICIESAEKDEFGGAALVVDSEDDLVHAANILPAETKPTEVYELTEAPGGGKCVTFYDPVDGFPFHLVHGQTPAEPLDPKFPEMRYNFPEQQNRPKNTFSRFEKRPAPVHKLGHFGMCVTNYAKCYEFYSTYFNFFPSELVHDDKGTDVTVFFRLNRGDELVDHHVFFFFEGPRAPHVHHSSFETHDFDAQVLGHDWLRHKGWENCWGVGRHIMGSQIFDYWFDPAGFILEHYVDGDLLDIHEPTHKILASLDNLHIWGPDLPPTFLT